MDDYKRGYSLGYAAGKRGVWPDHRPPKPPDALAARLMHAAVKLRDGVDAKLACLEESDEWTRELGPLIDAFDEANIAISRWLASAPSEVRDE